MNLTGLKSCRKCTVGYVWEVRSREKLKQEGEAHTERGWQHPRGWSSKLDKKENVRLVVASVSLDFMIVAAA